MVGSLCGASNLVLSLWGTDVLEAPRTSRMRRAVLTSHLRRCRSCFLQGPRWRTPRR
jgi:hypothetical protein